MYSLLYNNPNSDFKIHLIVEERGSVENIDYLYEIHERFELNVIEVDNSLKGVPEPNRFSTATYFRLLLGEMLPTDVDKVLYLDGDIIIHSKLDALFEFEVDNKTVAGVPHFDNHHLRFNIPIDTTYVNTGMLLINLNRWRELEVDDQAQNHISSKGFQDGLPIQTILNQILIKEIEPIHPRYNFTTDWRIESMSNGLNIDPVIIHYTGEYKPWEYRYSPRMGEEYWNYRDMTVYSGQDYEDRNVKNIILKNIRDGVSKLSSSTKYRNEIESIYRYLI